MFAVVAAFFFILDVGIEEVVVVRNLDSADWQFQESAAGKLIKP